jgi:hypothetical protein
MSKWGTPPLLAEKFLRFIISPADSAVRRSAEIADHPAFEKHF